MLRLLLRNALLLFFLLNGRKPRRGRSSLHHAATTKAMPNPKDSATRNRQEGTNRMCQRVGHVEFGHIAPYLKPHVNGNHSTSTPSLGRRCNDSSCSCTPYDQNITHYGCDAAISLNCHERLVSPKQPSLCNEMSVSLALNDIRLNIGGELIPTYLRGRTPSA